MKIFVYVKNFGKIKEAKIDISNFTVFVGENNSGKTYMIQLIYGILNSIEHMNEFKSNFLTDFEGEVELNENMYEQLNNDVNCYLDIYKNDIIKEIFNKEINIDILKVEIIPEKEDKISISFEDRLNRQIHLFNDEPSVIEWIKWVNIVHKKDKKIYEQDFGFFYNKTEKVKRERRQMLYRELVSSFLGINQSNKSSVLYYIYQHPELVFFCYISFFFRKR